MFNRIKRSIKYFRGVSNSTSIPMLCIDMDLSKDNTGKNCEVNFHPNIINQLSEDDKLCVEKYLGLVIQKIGYNVDFNK